MNWMSIADFEARYRSNPDPWGYTHSEYERQKYAATLAACGPGPFRCALELGSSIGVFSAMLAPRCERLVTIDAAATAVSSARDRLSSHPHVEPILGEIPDSLPDQTYDLVVASEILYYLSPARLRDTLAAVARRMADGARLVAVHWRPSGAERPFDAEQVHLILRGVPRLRSVETGGTDDYLLDVMVRE